MSVRGAATRLALALLVLPAALAAQGTAVDPRLAGALRDAVDGRLDSARVTLAALAKETPAGSAAYPDLLFAQSLVAPNAGETRQLLQRLVVEYPLSPWADDAALRLAQLEYAAGDHAAARRHAERFRSEHASSPLFPVAALWGGRAALAAKDTAAACRWADDGTARVGDDAPTRDALATLAARCRGKAPAAVTATTTPAKDAPTEPAKPPAGDTAGTTTPAWRVQIVAAQTAAEAQRELARARKAGFDGTVVQEGGFHKVRLGGFATRADATAAAQKVKAKLGGQPFVVRAP